MIRKQQIMCTRTVIVDLSSLICNMRAQIAAQYIYSGVALALHFHQLRCGPAPLPPRSQCLI